MPCNYKHLMLNITNLYSVPLLSHCNGSVVVATVVRGGAKYVITKSKINARALMFCAGMNSEHNMHETTYNVGVNSSVMYVHHLPRLVNLCVCKINRDCV